MRAIDLNANIPGCPNIKWKEILYLPQLTLYAHPHTAQIIANLISVCQRAQQVREILGNEPLTFTSGFRPTYYNRLIKGAKYSGHITGEALDFKHKTKTAQQCRNILEPHLKELRIRMEKHKGTWTHIDTKAPGRTGRYFKP